MHIFAQFLYYYDIDHVRHCTDQGSCNMGRALVGGLVGSGSRARFVVEAGGNHAPLVYLTSHLTVFVILAYGVFIPNALSCAIILLINLL